MSEGVFIKKEHIIYIAFAAVVVVGVVAYIVLAAADSSALIGQQVTHSNMQALQQIANNNSLAQQVGVGIIVPGVGSNLPKKITAPPYISNGKPEVLYVGGEFCPYCAVTRWGLIIALMRFGTFSNLTYMQSSAKDAYPSTPTFSFRNSSYHSTLINFNGEELTDRNEQPINSTNFTDQQQFVYGKYSSSGIPFIDFANTSVQSGSVVSPAILHGLNWDQAIANLTNQNSVVSQGVIGSADIFTAYICGSNQARNATAPACQQAYVKEILRSG